MEKEKNRCHPYSAYKLIMTLSNKQKSQANMNSWLTNPF